jgi:hypothetical protein
MRSKFFSYIDIIDSVIRKMAARREGAIVNMVTQPSSRAKNARVRWRAAAADAASQEAR